MAIDEHRSDFRPTIWELREGMDMQQVWFAGAHSNVGGSYPPDEDGTALSDNTLKWMIRQANDADLTVEDHLPARVRPNPTATLHDSRRSFYRLKDRHYRELDHGKGAVLIHESVKRRWDADRNYRPPNLKEYIDQHGWPDNLIHE